MNAGSFDALPRRARARSTLLVLACLAAVFLVKAVVLAQLDHHPLLQPAAGLDPAYYVELARQVAAGHDAPAGQAHFVSPLYVYFLAAVFVATGGALLAAKILQILLGTVAVWLVWRTTSMWFGPRAAAIAAVLAALCGFFTFCEVTMLQASLDPFLTAAALYLVARAWQSRRARDFLVAGFAVGLFALNRPNVLAYAVLLPPAALLLGRHVRSSRAEPAAIAATTRVRLAGALGIVFGLCLSIAPVAIRNARACGEWVLISSHGGLNFYIGNSALADGTYHAVPGITPSIAGQAADAKRVAEAATGRQLGPVEVSDYFARQAWTWIRSAPGAAIALFGRKLAYLFNSAWLTLNYSYPYYSSDEPTWLRILVVGPWLLIPLGVVGLVAPGVRQRRGYLPWILFVPVYALSVAAFFVSDRYRLPLLVPLVVGSGAAVDWLWRLVDSRRWRSAAIVAVPVVAFGVAANWPLGFDDGREAERTQMMLYEVDHHEDAAAMALLQRAQPESRDRPGLLRTVAGAYMERGNTDRALPLLEQASAIAPDRADIRRPLGDALLAEGRRALDRGDAPTAEALLRRAAGALPDSSAAFESLGLALTMLDRRAEAIVALETACRLDPASPSAHLNLAVNYADSGRLAEARRQAEEALRLKPDYAPARGLLDALSKAGKGAGGSQGR